MNNFAIKLFINLHFVYCSPIKLNVLKNIVIIYPLHIHIFEWNTVNV